MLLRFIALALNQYCDCRVVTLACDTAGYGLYLGLSNHNKDIVDSLSAIETDLVNGIIWAAAIFNDLLPEPDH